MGNPNDFLSRAIPVGPQNQMQQPKTNDFLSRAIPVESKSEESLGMTGLRNVGANALRAGETILEGHRNILSAAKNLGTGLIGKYGPKGLAENLMEAENNPESKYAKIVNEQTQRIHGQKFEHPGPRETLRDVTKKLTGEYFEPRNELEKVGQETTSDIAALWNPSFKVSQTLLKSTGLAALGQTAKQTAKEFGAEEGTADNWKAGTMIIGSFLNPNAYTRNMNQKYEAAKKLIPENAQTDAKILQRSLNLTKRSLQKGEQLPWKKSVLDTVESIESKIKNGKIAVSEVQQHIKDIYDKIGDWETKGKSKPFLKKLANQGNRQLKQYGKKSNPEWYKEWGEAQRLFSALAESKKASNFIHKSVSKFPKLSGLGAAAYGAIHPGLALAAGTGYAGVKSYELMDRIFMNRTAQKYYFNAIKNSLNENKGAVIKDLAALDKELSKSSS